MLNKSSKIYLSGHAGMVGSSIYRLLQSEGYKNIVVKNRRELDLIKPDDVERFFKIENPEYVIMAAAKVGGIQANIDSPADFLYENLMIQNNIINFSELFKVKKVVFLASSCIYPKKCQQPMKEEYLMTGSLEPTNEGYALAKIIGIKLIESYRKQFGLLGINLIPCNLYGTNDSFNPKNSHVLSALVKKFVDAVDDNLDKVTIWGSGMARREFLHVDDCARAVLFTLKNYESVEPINIGCGFDVSIKELANLVAKKTNFNGKLEWDKSKPEGMLKKCLDISKLNELGFSPEIILEEGVRMTIEEYKNFKTNKNLIE